MFSVGGLRPLILVIVVLAALGVWMFSEAPEEFSGEEKIVVAVSIPPMAEWVERVGGEKVRVVVLVPREANPHIYEPSPSKIVEASRAKILVLVGLGFERWADEVLEVNREAYIIRVADLAEPLMVNGKPDPHMWLSPRIAVKVIPEIEHTLSKVDPENGEYYRVRMEKYVEELKKLDLEISAKLSELKVRKFFVLHPAWRYFARDYGLEQVAILEHEDASASHLAKLIDEAKALKVRVVFAEPWCSRELAEILADEVGCEIRFLDPLAQDYAENLRVSAYRIAEALGGR